MRYQLLGRTGLRVSELSLGTMTFGDTADKSTTDSRLEIVIFALGRS